MEYVDIVSKVASDLELPSSYVDKIYRAYWRAILEYVTSLPLKEDLTDDEFLKLRPNVNIPALGKLCVSLDRYRAIKKRNEYLNQLKLKDNVTH